MFWKHGCGGAPHEGSGSRSRPRQSQSGPLGFVRLAHDRRFVDRNDARGIAQMMRVGLYRPVHVKTLRSQKLPMLLTHRKRLQSKAIAIENDLRESE